MDMLKATDAFAALSQPVRLSAYRLLVQAGERGMPAGAIAEALDMRQNTLSANLAVLLHAGLVRRARCSALSWKSAAAGGRSCASR